MSIGRQSCIHPGWGSVIENYNKATTLDIGRFNVFSVHHISSVPNAFMTPSDCALVNVWECAFLPLTNCSLPTVVTSCRSQECLWPEREMFNELFLPANASGKPVLRARLRDRGPEGDMQLRLHRLFEGSGESQLRFSYPAREATLYTKEELEPHNWVFGHMLVRAHISTLNRFTMLLLLLLLIMFSVWTSCCERLASTGARSARPWPCCSSCPGAAAPAATSSPRAVWRRTCGGATGCTTCLAAAPST